MNSWRIVLALLVTVFMLSSTAPVVEDAGWEPTTASPAEDAIEDQGAVPDEPESTRSEEVANPTMVPVTPGDVCGDREGMI